MSFLLQEAQQWTPCGPTARSHRWPFRCTRPRPGCAAGSSAAPQQELVGRVWGLSAGDRPLPQPWGGQVALPSLNLPAHSASLGRCRHTGTAGLWPWLCAVRDRGFCDVWRLNMGSECMGSVGRALDLKRCLPGRPVSEKLYKSDWYQQDEVVVQWFSVLFTHNFTHLRFRTLFGVMSCLPWTCLLPMETSSL